LTRAAAADDASRAALLISMISLEPDVLVRYIAVVHEKRNLKEMLFAVTLPKKVIFRLVLLSALHKSGDNELYRAQENTRLLF